MTSNLFRTQAIRAKTQPPFGPASIVTPIGTGLLSVCTLLVGASVIMFVVHGEYRDRETVPGVITTTEANVRVHAQTTGVVSEILVAEGEAVRKRQPLVRLDTARVTATGKTAEKEILAAINEEYLNVEEQIRQSQLLAGDRKKSLEHRIRAAHAQLEKIDSQHVIVLKQKRIALANSERFVRVQNLGHGSIVDQDFARERYLNVEIQLNVLLRERQREQDALRQAQFELRQLPNIELSHRAEQEVTLQRLRQRLVDTRARQSTTIVAPIAGRVSGLNLRVGQTLTPSQSALTLLPDETHYYAELYVPPHAIGFIQPDAKVQIRYDAFPHQKFGVHAGRVTDIARTVTDPVGASGSFQSPTPTYRLRVTLETQSIEAYGKTRPLRAGMTLQADILRDQRRIIEWIFDPLLSATTRI